MGADYYGVLGVDKKADDAELKKGKPIRRDWKEKKGRKKKRSIDRASARPFPSPVLTLLCPRTLQPTFTAYRKLAMKWHPVREREMKSHQERGMEEC